MKTNFLILIGFLVLVSCEPKDMYKFRIINNSDKDLYFYEAVINAPIYPDTLIRETKVQLRVWANTTSHQGGIISTEEVFRRHNIDTMSIYLFDAETVDNIPWETIREEYKVLKRYDLNLEDIQFLDYEISYPPTEQMKDMRMYPPYEE